MRWVVIVTLWAAGLLWVFLLGNRAHHEAGNSTEIVAQQQEALLAFEQQVQCEAHTLCADATYDGQGERDPANAVRQCTTALERIDLVMVPDIFPERIKKQLEKFKKILRMSVESSLQQAKENVAAQEGPTKYGFSFSFKSHSTCEAYSLIDKINRMYGVQKLMQGHYINCNVLQAR